MATSKPYSPVKPQVNLSELEEQILAFWDKNQIFEQSLTSGASTKHYSFYDGPPFATGLPHYGHIMAGVLKDVVPRYATMKGYKVARRFGWDCHGLPVEYEINKALKIENNKQIYEMGIAKYNAECRSIVQRYSQEWKKTVKRLGRWVDMENAYFTMSVEFMESVWWVVKELFSKGLVYEGYKVVPYSTGISTPLSNFEANLNYKQVQDPAITVSFPVIREANTSLLAWTTTPWTLPSNLALAVGEDIDYAYIKDSDKNHTYILAEALVKTVFKKDAKIEILKTVKGSALVNIQYTPLFDYFLDKKKEGAFKVIIAPHVTTESGTGIVHMAPAFGEEDYTACHQAGLPIVNPVDDDGMFTAEVPNYQGKRVKDADKEIILEIKNNNRLFKQETITHSYPYCWRSDTPLIYRAVSSWFVNIEKIKDQIVANNKTTHWVPEHLRDGRFGKWLDNARDWAISRNRFWGTPIPIWKNIEGEVICVGSKEELEQLTQKTINDLHREFVDDLEIPSPTGKSPLKRITSVLDCWFESGSMPYAQWGYPKTHQKEFKENFPADFIAEGLDQTRGWFYTLMVIGTALFDKAPFKNVVVNGLILAEDGKKMSKSLRNYPDPMIVLNQHGADALRLYLIDSPAVKAQELRFSETGVKDIVRKILLRWWNSYSFFISYANIDEFKPKGDYQKSPNILDQWIISRLHSLLQNTEKEMSAYRLYNVVPQLLQFIEGLTNTYIRFNRSHFWQEGMPEDKRFAYETLYHVLFELSRMMAPFAPFLSETVFQNLAQVHSEKRKQSVHLEQYPVTNSELIKPDLEEAVRVMETLVVLGRNYREKISIKAKIPLKSLKIIHREQRVLDCLKLFEPYFADELNVRKIEYLSNEDDFVQISIKANFPALGPRFGAKMKQVAAIIQKANLKDILKLEQGHSMPVEGGEITRADVEIRRAPKPGLDHVSTHQLVSIELDPSVDQDQLEEGLAREVIRKIQAARKNADFNLDDRIILELNCTAALMNAAKSQEAMIAQETLSKEVNFVSTPKGEHTESVEIEEGQIMIGISRIKK